MIPYLPEGERDYKKEKKEKKKKDLYNCTLTKVTNLPNPRLTERPKGLEEN